MNKIIITTDSSCSLSNDILQKYNIQICPISILVGDDEYFDTVDIDSEKVLELVKEKGVLPKTSAVSESRYLEFFTKFVNQGYTVIHFNISSKVSCCHQNALSASKKLDNVHVIDSKLLSSGQGFLIIKVAQLIERGESLEQILISANNMIPKIHISFVIDTLDFLAKGGRCSSVALIASKVLKIRPSIIMTDGELKIKTKHMGSLKVCVNKHLNEIVKEFEGKIDDELCLVAHSPVDTEVLDFATNKIASLFKFNTITKQNAGTTITSHCGYGTIGIIFLEK